MGYIHELRKVVGTRPLIMVGACVLLLNDKNELLLQLRTDNHMWGLAGGSIEPGEGLEETAKRELFEETGLTANEISLFNIFSGPEFYYQYPHGDEVYNVVSAYVCRNYEGVLMPDEKETSALQFFPLHKLPPNMNPVDIPIVNELLATQDITSPL
ncbi:8-oxo-dGTP pyrophosphatase MutT (NUDIX family) [Fictibacillus halophilus]|uniref:8-oxo-dGTP pyrophosphatase MutT (NUDIX family) n=1 Tax=Fictibacillus halophilus TaxID=1610490 RepID=A0ABV2LHB6_9BACL|nr:NUDIX hydrolase [Fictibacillus halophilus]